MDTIYAVSSGQPPAAIAVLRVSGPGAFAAAAALASSLPPVRRAGLRGLRAADGALLDRALVLRFAGPATATGEDLVELHCHGGRAVVAAVEAALAAQGLRRAEPGEFTRRALINGRIDLAEAEGLADLLEAQTERQRLVAISAAEGQVSRAIGGWMARLTMLSAQVEALLDFADEDDVPDDARMTDIRGAMRALGTEIADVAAAPAVDRLIDGIRVVIAGPPNSGKSTLLNTLGARDAAIVSSIAGTTRDRIEVPVVRAGVAYILTDTAGLNVGTDDAIEAIGIDLAEAAMAAADILLWTGDTPPGDARAIWLHMRSDIAGRETMPAGRTLRIARDDRGSIAALWDHIATRAQRLLPRVDALPLKRHQQMVCGEVGAILTDAPSEDLLIIAESLRLARLRLAGLLGQDATETMLDALFGRFCIGK